MEGKTRQNNTRWVSPQQAADHLGCSRNFLDKDRITRLHGIPFARLGRHIRYDIADLDAFLERSKVLPGGEESDD
jgi:excisionase family DNA binding protein